jgi:hypothetical protein
VAALLAVHRTAIRPTTRLHYTRDVERVLIPHLGRLCLADLDGRRLRAAFAEIAQTTNSKGLPQSASAMQHLRTTLRGSGTHDHRVTAPARRRGRPRSVTDRGSRHQ